MGSQRENRIDLLRGLSLLLIFIGHAEFSFSTTFQHSRGFSDASEIFVLLAGISAALAYYRPDTGLQLERPWKRALRLYLVHLLLFAIMAVIAAFVLTVFDDAARAVDMTDFWRAPLFHSLEALPLSYMPGNLDILPMYVVLFLAVPFIFVLHDWSKAGLLAGSFTLWIVAGLGHINFPNTALKDDVWYFDPLSWQFIFTVGVCLGVRLKSGLPMLPYYRAVFAAAAAFALVAIPLNLAIHLGVVQSPFGALHHELASKTNSGPLRIINVLAILYVVWSMPSMKALSNHPSMRLLCIAGRHSLPIFATGVLLSFCAVVVMKLNPDTPLSQQLAMLVVGCGIQLAIGWVFEKRKRARVTDARRTAAPQKASSVLAAAE